VRHVIGMTLAVREGLIASHAMPTARLCTRNECLSDGTGIPASFNTVVRQSLQLT